jgi:hypothetical protein
MRRHLEPLSSSSTATAGWNRGPCVLLLVISPKRLAVHESWRFAASCNPKRQFHFFELSLGFLRGFEINYSAGWSPSGKCSRFTASRRSSVETPR